MRDALNLARENFRIHPSMRITLRDIYRARVRSRPIRYILFRRQRFANEVSHSAALRGEILAF